MSNRTISRVSRALDREIAERQIEATNRLGAAIERHADALDAVNDNFTDVVCTLNRGRIVDALVSIGARPSGRKS
jgi:hypothetical protein